MGEKCLSHSKLSEMSSSSVLPESVFGWLSFLDSYPGGCQHWTSFHFCSSVSKGLSRGLLPFHFWCVALLLPMHHKFKPMFASLPRQQIDSPPIQSHLQIKRRNPMFFPPKASCTTLPSVGRTKKPESGVCIVWASNRWFLYRYTIIEPIWQIQIVFWDGLKLRWKPANVWLQYLEKVAALNDVFFGCVVSC